MKSLNVIDLFAGVGGLSYGFYHNDLFKIVAANEILHEMSFAYSLNHPDVLMYEKDIVNLTADEVYNDIGIHNGDIDLIIANGRHWPGQNKIFINDGRGIFTIEKNLGVERSPSYAAELGDFDLDGDLDIAVGNDMAPNYIFTNNGKGDFIKTGSFGKQYSKTRNITLSDLDSDVDIDILITNRGEPNEICLNNGKGQFLETFSFGSKDDATIDVEVSDMNNDGYKDLILANRNSQPNYIYINDGNLNFNRRVQFGTGRDNTRAIGVADFNKDGYKSSSN